MRFPSPARRGSAAATCLLVALLAPLARAQNAEQVDTTRNVFKEWAETSRKIATARADWTLGKELLTDRIALLKQQIAALQETIDQADKKLAGVAKTKQKLTRDRDRLQNAAGVLTAKVGPIEAQTRALLAGLPVMAEEQVKVFGQRIPGAPAAPAPSATAPKSTAPKSTAPKGTVPESTVPKSAVAKSAKDDGKDGTAAPRELPALHQRYQNVVGVLLGLNKFNRGVHLTNELRKLSDGTTAEVATLYFGLGQAYYVNARGDRAGVGTATPDGWTWTAADSAAKQVALAIAIYENKEGAAFVRLPVYIR